MRKSCLVKSCPVKPKTLVTAIMLAGLPLSVIAQQDPALEEIIVTGSLIRGTPVDSALPVEVFTAEELRETGNPTALEFVKSLTASGPTTGEAYYFSGSGTTSNVGVNLRGIGADKTLTLFNGRRASENTSLVPNSAIARVEVLKDGAAVTYGADATGGVVNFITKDSFEGFELSSSYKYFGSDGDWNISGVAGRQFGDTNVMIAAEWDHRSELDAIDRDFTDLPYSVNPAPWSTLTNLAGWVPRGALPTEPGNTANSQWGSPLGLASDFTQGSCEAVGGTYVGSFTCAYDYIPYYNVVEENEVYRLFGQVTTQMTERSEFYVRAAFGRVLTPHAYGSPSQPVVQGPARATGATYQIYAPAINPFVNEFATRSGWADNALFGLTEGYTPITYRAFAHGGNDTFAEGGSHSTPNLNDNRNWHISAGFNGELESGISYDMGLTYNQGTTKSKAPDILGFRLQEALNGFGGPGCEAADLDPNLYGTQNPGAAGTGSCLWYNPFASNFAGQPVLGLSNPSYVPGTENPEELVSWLFNDRLNETTSWNLTADFLLSGETPLQLPGGPLSWGAGIQWRDTRFQETITDPLYNGSTPCAWPGQAPYDPADPAFDGCTPDEPGPFFFFGTNSPDSTQQDQFSYFGELSIPLLESLYLTAAVRHEAFSGDLDATVYKVSGKWDITENLAVRGAYGTNYQAPGAGIIPGNVGNGVTSYNIAGGNWRGSQTITESGIEPETATVWSTGVIWQSRGFADDHDVQIILDYFDVETEDELALLASANEVASSVFRIPPSGSGSVPSNGTALADCSHPLINRVTFNGGACEQGVTTANDFSRISTAFGNGPGQHTAGFDLQTSYRFPAFAGDVRLGLTATKVDTFEFSETSLDGFVLDPGEDRLGVLNFSAVAGAAPEWKMNFNANYSQGEHNFRFVANYVSGVDDERYINADGSINTAALIPAGFQPGTSTRFLPTFYGVKGDDWISGDFHYVWNMALATLNFSIINITDEDPPNSRQEMGYDPRIGNPLGRQFEIGFRKEF